MDCINNIRKVLSEIGDVQLVLATKTRTIKELTKVHEVFPDLVFGENRVQELLSKYTDKFKWHLVGQLQTNKVKYIIDKVELIHSVDRIALVAEIDKRAKSIGKVQDCLIEINLTDDENRGGVQLSGLDSLINSSKGYENVSIKGLMAVMPAGCDEISLRKHMQTMKELKDKYAFPILSMGMSSDYKIALEYGTSMVRLGRTIFGERL